MEHIHSIIIVKKGNKYLNIYDDRWGMLLFPNIKGNNIEDIIKYVNNNFNIKVNRDEIKLLFDKIHEKYSVSNKRNKIYHHYFYEINNSSIEGDFYTLEELLSIEKVKENNSDIISFIDKYYSKKSLHKYMNIKGEKIMNEKLNNGVEIPCIGIGTFMLQPKDAENSVREAIKMGYRLIDTANAYVNERAVGRGIKDSGINRNEIFVSTKLWPSEYENPNAVDETLERLNLDYIDLLFLHQPAGNWKEGYKNLEKAYKEGKIKAIGISNFEGEYIEELLNTCEIIPQVIQVEAHPYYPQDELRTIIDEKNIKLMSWYPLGHGDKSLINEEIFRKLGEKYNKTPAQIILKWHIKMGFIVIPGSKNVEHIKDNFNLFDFDLTNDEMNEISKLNNGRRYYHRTEEQLKNFAAWSPEYEVQ